MLKLCSFRKLLSFLLGGGISLVIIFLVYSHLLSNQLVLQGESIYRELQTTAINSYDVIQSLNEKGFTRCTKENLFEMRKAQFESNDIKDIGFFENRILTCTTGVGLLDKIVRESTPDFIRDGHKYWIDKALLTFNQKVLGVIIQDKSYNIVLSFQSILKEYNQKNNYEIISVFDGKSSHLYGQLGLYKNIGAKGEVHTISGLFIHYMEFCEEKGGICVAAEQQTFSGLLKFPILFVFIIIFILSGVSALYLSDSLTQYFRSTRRRVKSGLSSGCFTPHYQAIVDMRTGQVVGCELLARFEDKIGSLSPDEFIPVVADLNLSWTMTDYFIRQALNDFANISSSGKPFYLSINVFPKDINNGNILKGIELVKQLNPNLQVVFEITEDEQVSFDELTSTLAQLNKSPIKMSIDDFGTGYSNLSQLKHLDINTLKIDKSFVDEVETGAIRSTLIPNIIAIADKLGADVIAEGVENELQVNVLLNMKIIYGQGWYYVKALPIEEFSSYLLLHSEFTNK
ncbi:EAL domain-containing protein [Thalassotalea piscium]